jgi:hypothetical protein
LTFDQSIAPKQAGEPVDGLWKALQT